jgi:hypothetical protein
MADQHDSLETRIAEERRRELAVEHLLFGTIRFVASRHPELLDQLEASLDHLGDVADAPDKDDEAVRTVARRFIKGLRSPGRS